MQIATMSLKERLTATPARETSGSRSANRFAYQKNWAICELLERHQSGADYLMLLEFHEDICILDSESEPTHIDFYQVKTKDKGSWTLDNLLKRDPPKALSIIGKLYHNKITFPEDTRSLNFVSNAAFSVPLLDGRPSSLSLRIITGQDLSEQACTQMGDRLKEEHSLTDEPCFKELLFLRVADLSLLDQSNHAIGKLASFLEQRFPNERFSAPAFYRSILGELQRRNDRENTSAEADRILAEKGISRSKFESILSTVTEGPRINEAWSSFQNRLSLEAYPPLGLQRLHREWRRNEVERLDKNNVLAQRARQFIRQHLGSAEETTSLTELLDKVLTSCHESSVFTENSMSDDQIRAMILMELATVDA